MWLSQKSRNPNQVRQRGAFAQEEVEMIHVLDWQECQLLSENIGSAKDEAYRYSG